MNCRPPVRATHHVRPARHVSEASGGHAGAGWARGGGPPGVARTRAASRRTPRHLRSGRASPDPPVAPVPCRCDPASCPCPLGDAAVKKERLRTDGNYLGDHPNERPPAGESGEGAVGRSRDSKTPKNSGGVESQLDSLLQGGRLHNLPSFATRPPPPPFIRWAPSSPLFSVGPSHRPPHTGRTTHRVGHDNPRTSHHTPPVPPEYRSRGRRKGLGVGLGEVGGHTPDTVPSWRTQVQGIPGWGEMILGPQPTTVPFGTPNSSALGKV